jgi:hypothetical protein
VLTVPDPDPEPTQVLLIAKQPLVRLIPLANVDDAVVEETFRMFADIPPVKVEVAVVVEMRLPTVMTEEVDVNVEPS